MSSIAPQTTRPGETTGGEPGQGSQPAVPNDTESEPKVSAGRTSVRPSGITATPRLKPTTGRAGAAHFTPSVVAYDTEQAS